MLHRRTKNENQGWWCAVLWRVCRRTGEALWAALRRVHQSMR